MNNINHRGVMIPKKDVMATKSSGPKTQLDKGIFKCPRPKVRSSQHLKFRFHDAARLLNTTKKAILLVIAHRIHQSSVANLIKSNTTNILLLHHLHENIYFSLHEGSHLESHKSVKSKNASPKIV